VAEVAKKKLKGEQELDLVKRFLKTVEVELPFESLAACEVLG
jgi:hypothetical protein